MYFYIGRNNKPYHNFYETEGVKNAQVVVIACFNENRDLIIYDIKRKAGTEFQLVLKTVKIITNFAIENKAKRVINEAHKLPNSFLRKIGFETINGCTLFETIG